MKFEEMYHAKQDRRRSREGAWIEIHSSEPAPLQSRSRSREGAWIEISNRLGNKYAPCVAPVRERGLKFDGSYLTQHPRESLP